MEFELEWKGVRAMKLLVYTVMRSDGDGAGLASIDIFSRARNIRKRSFCISFRSRIRVWMNSLPDSEEAIDVTEFPSQYAISPPELWRLLTHDATKRSDQKTNMVSKPYAHSARPNHVSHCACSPANYTIRLSRLSSLCLRREHNLIGRLVAGRSGRAACASSTYCALLGLEIRSGGRLTLERWPGAADWRDSAGSLRRRQDSGQCCDKLRLGHQAESQRSRAEGGRCSCTMDWPF